MTELETQPAPTHNVGPPNFGLTKFRDPLRIPRIIRTHSWWPRDRIKVRLKRTRERLHSQLPKTELWTYDGQFPGPTIEVRSGSRLRIEWVNDIEGVIPLVGVSGPVSQAPTSIPGGYLDAAGELLPGFAYIDGVSDLPAWTVVHLHGALTNGGNDGWSHNATLAGRSQLAEYPNEQRAATLWYHDHAMAVTRFNLHVGLAGMYLIRDDEEDQLDLPAGRREVPLNLCDRNLDTEAASGALTGDLLFKVPSPAPGAMIPFTGPFNLVNGVIWPHLEVDARWYRFRLLNSSNSRFYTLDLADKAGAVHNDAVHIIGTDGGLLPTPAPVPAIGLTLAPAERADVLIDFSAFKGQRLRFTDRRATGGPTEPDLIEFRVDDRDRHDEFVLPEVLSRNYVRLEHGTTLPDDHHHVFVAVVPPLTAGAHHPQMWELRELTDPGQIPPVPAIGIIQLRDPFSGQLRTFEKVASLFDDTTTFFIDHGRWVVWNLINLGGPPHPMHIHMAQFQMLTRKQYPLNQGTVVGFDVAVGGTSAPLAPPGDGRVIEKYEEGWKDTFQLQPGEWITIAGQFAGATGEFMYHCHILDHEDDGMMRPFVVHPAEVAKFHRHPGGGHGDHSPG
jgi:FtsP/CotA-like multicopper oxidase with cupredoxin domain